MSRGMATPELEIELTCDLQAFFQRAVEYAREEEGFSPTDTAERYLVGVLTDFAKGDSRAVDALDRPITLVLEDAFQTMGPDRFERLRSLGDTLLYTTGFFSEHLRNRGVEPTYASALGARAYDGAASILRHFSQDARPVPDLFRELADNFPLFVALVARTADAFNASTAGSSDRAVLRLYERWQRTRSSSIAAALSARGVVPVRGEGGVH